MGNTIVKYTAALAIDTRLALQYNDDCTLDRRLDTSDNGLYRYIQTTVINGGYTNLFYPVNKEISLPSPPPRLTSPSIPPPPPRVLRL